MVLYARQLHQSGVTVRGIVIVYSDGPTTHPNKVPVTCAGLDHSELRRIFHLASMSAVQVSQGTAVPASPFI